MLLFSLLIFFALHLFQYVLSISIGEQSALCDFISATNIGQLVNSGWLCTPDEHTTGCSWTGVFCEDDQVYGIKLASMGLRGSIPQSISNLLHLQYLVLNNNAMFGRIPASMGRMTKLAVLDLHANYLVGSLPTTFGSLSALRKLNLAKNQLVGQLTSLEGNLSYIEEMYLSSNKFTGTIPSHFFRFPFLWRLELRSNLLNAPISESICDNNVPIRSFDVRQNNITCLPNCLVSGRQSAFKWDNNLLACSGLRIASDIILPVKVRVDITAMNYVPYASQMNESIAICALLDAFGYTGPEKLPTWECSAHVLNGVNTSLPTSDPCLYWDYVICSFERSTKNIDSWRSHIIALRLSKRQLEGTLPEAIAGFDYLTALDLSKNSLVGEIPKNIGKIKSLASFALNGNEMVGSLPHQLGELSALEFLNLRNNHFAYPVPYAIGSLQRLKYLDIALNSLTGSLPTSMVQMSSLAVAYIDQNQLTGSLPIALTPQVKFEGFVNSNLRYLSAFGNYFACSNWSRWYSVDPDQYAFGNYQSWSQFYRVVHGVPECPGEEGIIPTAAPTPTAALVTKAPTPVPTRSPTAPLAFPPSIPATRQPTRSPTVSHTMSPTFVEQHPMNAPVHTELTPTSKGCFEDCVLHPADAAGSVYTLPSETIITFGKIFDMIQKDNYDAELCSLYTSINCTANGVVSATCIPPCLNSSTCAFVFCDTFSTLEQICFGANTMIRFNSTRKVTYQHRCGQAYLLAYPQTPVASFTITVSLGNLLSTDDLLGDYAATQALADAISALLQNVLSIQFAADSSWFMNSTTPTTLNAKELVPSYSPPIQKIQQRPTSTFDSFLHIMGLSGAPTKPSLKKSNNVRAMIKFVPTPISSKSTNTSVPLSGATALMNSVNQSIVQINKAVADRSLTKSFIANALRQNATTVVNVVRQVVTGSVTMSNFDLEAAILSNNGVVSAETLDSLIPQQSVTTPGSEEVVYIQTPSPSRIPTFMPTPAPTSRGERQRFMHGQILGAAVLVASAVVLAVWYCRRTYVTYRKHKEPVNFKVLDKLFPQEGEIVIEPLDNDDELFEDIKKHS